MTRNLMSLTLLTLVLSGRAFAADQRWPFDHTDSPNLTRHGSLKTAAGVEGGSVVFDGQSVLTAKDSTALSSGTDGFTLAVWVNPYLLCGQQQMIAAKNRYSLDERQWGVMVDKDDRFRLYVWQGRWATVDSKTAPQTGHWHLVGVVVRSSEAELWVNGKRTGSVKLTRPIPRTNAPLTFGAVDDNARVWQNLFGALDEARLFDRALTDEQMAAMYRPVSATHEIPRFAGWMDVEPDPEWNERIAEHAEQDRTSLVFDGKSPDKLACDTTLRLMPDGSWVMVMLGGGDKEPDPRNQVFITRSHDAGKTWSPMTPLDFGFPREGNTKAMVPSELMVHGGRCTLFFATHGGRFDGWREWMAVSEDSCRTWSSPMPAPGRLKNRTFIRNHIVTRDGRILLPFQHYLGEPGPRNPRNGVLMSSDGGRTWTEHGNIRISSNDGYRGWAENNIVELTDGRIAMIIRADGLGGVLYYAESTDGGRTWPEYARRTTIPNPGSKATLYPLGDDTVALLHNPNPRHRSPMALWISFDGLQTWPYQRVLVPESVDGPKGRLNYPDGFVSKDKRWLHFAFDDNRHRAVYVGARLPE
ncbi:MAG: exo-alpha-sialidase [Planctomycetota bacterium]|jgi:hypothetical protein